MTNAARNRGIPGWPSARHASLRMVDFKCSRDDFAASEEHKARRH